MNLLGDGEISRIHEAAVSAGLGPSRSALFTAIDRFLVDSIALEDSADRQILIDLRILDRAGKSTDGTIPLEIWLRNAEILSGPRVEAEVFRRCAEACRGAAARVEPEAPRSSWAVAPSLALAALRPMDPAAGLLVEESEIVQLLDATTRLGWVNPGHREALLAGISSAILGEIPRGETPIAQMALDVALLAQPRFAGLPILRWLANACVLAGSHGERAAFSSRAAGLAARSGIRDPGLDLDPPLATQVERILEFAATYWRPQHHAQMFAQLDMPPIAPPHWGGSAMTATLSNFYRLYAASPGKDGDLPLLRWLSNLRGIAKVKRSDPLAAALQEQEARHVRHVKLRS